MAERYFSRLILARSSRTCSWSSRNLRNMTQVSIGRRSRSPLSPLSFRMMSRADLTRLPSRWALVRGAAVFLSFRRVTGSSSLLFQAPHPLARRSLLQPFHRAFFGDGGVHPEDGTQSLDD